MRQSKRYFQSKIGSKETIGNTINAQVVLGCPYVEPPQSGKKPPFYNRGKGMGLEVYGNRRQGLDLIGSLVGRWKTAAWATTSHETHFFPDTHSKV